MTWHAEKDALLATVAAGYADGIFRSLSNKGALYWQGIRCPIRGRVSMDLTTVDISGVPEKQRPKPGDMMELIGEHQSADELAHDAGTIGYEVLTDLGHRYERIYVGDDIMRMSGGKSSSASGA
jgi:alanine racemase